ncbi:wall-associated receptor kinase 2-like [Trifolium medium]|uniref:Wall-associated receptor kinase 2-like n=1 Tax=Trifolium medium TaxID=97028 RepID=A0A392PGZ8_9FABA|nr:wall-associated receptor kinase 2-like [Trifolium medium]
MVGVVVITDYKGKNYTTGCVSLCYRLDDIITNGSCTGTGCCEISIPQSHDLLSDIAYISLDAVSNHTGVVDFNPCGYTFVVEDGGYEFVSTDIVKMEKKEFPVVLDWSVGNRTCQEAQKEVSSYACKADNSECYNPSDHRHGYLCNCSVGFRGNPYLLHGCQGIVAYNILLPPSQNKCRS